MVATIATVEASGMETSTSIMPAVAAKMAEVATTAVLAVAVRTATAEDVVFWVASYLLATSRVQLMAQRTTMTLVVTALKKVMVVLVMVTEWRKLTADAESEAEKWIVMVAAIITPTAGACMH
jgi:hypothetical protein